MNMTPSRTSEYRAWNSMVQRCKNPNNAKFIRYGHRGIRVCDEWLTFSGFIKDMGEKPGSDYSIERIDNDGNYEPSNCRWATRIDQMNNRSINHFIKHAGKNQTMAQWGRELGIPARRISYRLIAGWSIENALLLPVSKVRVSIENHKKRKSC